MNTVLKYAVPVAVTFAALIALGQFAPSLRKTITGA